MRRNQREVSLVFGGGLINRNNPADFKRLNIFSGLRIKLAFAPAIQNFKLRLIDLQAAAFPAFSTLPYSATSWPGLKRSRRYSP